MADVDYVAAPRSATEKAWLIYAMRVYIVINPRWRLFRRLLSVFNYPTARIRTAGLSPPVCQSVHLFLGLRITTSDTVNTLTFGAHAQRGLQ